MQLISTNLGGNLHVASNTINEMGLADKVLHMQFSGSNTVVVFRVSDEEAPALREYFGVPARVSG
jgi:hypothetical protein